MKRLDYTTIFFAIMGSFLVLFILIPILNLMVSSDLNSIIANLHDSQVISAMFVSVYCALIATLIAVYGLFMTPLGWGWAMFVWGYALVWFLLNDRLKLLAYRIFDPVKTETLSDLTPQIAKQT